MHSYLCSKHILLYVSKCNSSSFRSSDGNSSLLHEGDSASQIPQATVELAGYRSVIWPDSLPEWLVDGTGLQEIFCLLQQAQCGH